MMCFTLLFLGCVFLCALFWCLFCVSVLSFLCSGLFFSVLFPPGVSVCCLCCFCFFFFSGHGSLLLFFEGPCFRFLLCSLSEAPALIEEKRASSIVKQYSLAKSLTFYHLSTRTWI